MSSCARTNLGSRDREIDASPHAGHMPKPSAFAVFSDAGSGFNAGDLVTFLEFGLNRNQRPALLCIAQRFNPAARPIPAHDRPFPVRVFLSFS